MKKLSWAAVSAIAAAVSALAAVLALHPCNNKTEDESGPAVPDTFGAVTEVSPEARANIISAVDVLVKSAKDAKWRAHRDFLRAAKLAALSDTARAFEYAVTSIDLLPESPEAQLLLGRLYQRQGNTDKAVERFEAVKESTASDAWKSLALVRLAGVEWSRDNHRDSLSLLEEAEALGAKNPALYDAELYGNLGLIYRDGDVAERDLSAAFESFIKSLNLYIKHRKGVQLSPSQICSAVPHAYTEAEPCTRNDRVEDYCRRAQEPLEPQWDALWGEAVQLGNIGVVHRRNGHPKRALACYQASFFIHRKLGNCEGVASQLRNISVIHFEQGELDRSEDYLRCAWKIDSEIDRPRGLGMDWANYGALHERRGEEKRAHSAFENSALQFWRAGVQKRALVLWWRLYWRTAFLCLAGVAVVLVVWRWRTVFLGKMQDMNSRLPRERR